MVPESEIAEHLRLCQYPHETLRSLLARANARGGLDNITAVLLLAEK
jgi:serine/threonine protein phosphatase PrpC